MQSTHAVTHMHRDRFTGNLPWPLADATLMPNGMLRMESVQRVLSGGPFDWMHMSGMSMYARIMYWCSQHCHSMLCHGE